MDISKDEQRVLHALAKGGRLQAVKTSSGRILDVELITREGWAMPGVTARLFRKLKSKRAIASRQGPALPDNETRTGAGPRAAGQPVRPG